MTKCTFASLFFGKLQFIPLSLFFYNFDPTNFKKKVLNATSLKLSVTFYELFLCSIGTLSKLDQIGIWKWASLFTIKLAKLIIFLTFQIQSYKLLLTYEFFFSAKLKLSVKENKSSFKVGLWSLFPKFFTFWSLSILIWPYLLTITAG